MKQKSLVLFVLMMVLLLTGCGNVQEAEETTVPGPVVVSTVEELLAAIAPDAEILIAPGRYNLYWSRDYGVEPETGYYTWEDTGDGFQLKITGVQNLTIRGSGMDQTSVLTEPRYANVLVLQNCTNVVLEDFTAGHTDGGSCAGGVVSLKGCAGIEMNRMGLFGCGTVGVEMELCSRISLLACEIYECSSNGILANRTDGLILDHCKLRDLGEQYSGGSAIWLGDSTDVRVSGCEITDNDVIYLLGCDDGMEVTLKDNVFARNRVENAVFDLYRSGMVMDGCRFENNHIRSWFSGAGVTILDGVGKTWTEEMLEREYNPEVKQQPAGEQTVVTVSNVDELLSAIAPDTEIILRDGDYDLSTAADYGSGYSDWYYWQEEFDGPVLVIDGVNNLTIRSESGIMRNCTISAVPRYANIFNFRKCSNITLSGFTAGHTVEPGECMGGVLDFEGCDTVLVETCGLFGCGILGVQARLSGDITVKNCDIYECSYGGIQMADVVGVSIESCTFRDLGGEALSFYDCKEVTVDGKPIDGRNYYGE